MRAAAAILCVALLGLLAGPGAGQEAPAVEAAAAAPKPTPTQELTTLDLAKRLEELASEIATVESDLPKTADLIAAKDRLDVLQPEARKILERAQRARVETISPIARDALEQALGKLDRQVETARGPLDARVARLERSRQRLRAGAELIETRLAAPDAGDLPETLRQRMNSLRNGIERTRASVRRALDITVVQSERAAKLQQQLADARKVIKDVGLAENRATLGPERPPIWQAGFWKPPAELDLGQRLGDSVNSVMDLLDLYPGRWALLALALVGLVAGTLRLRRLALADGDAAATDLIVRHPLAAAILIWAAIGPDLAGLSLPNSVGIVRIVIIVAAAWPLIGRMAPAGPRLPLLSLLVLAVLATWTVVMLDADGGTLVFLVIGIVTLLLLLRLLKVAAKVPLSRSPRLAALLRLGAGLGALLVAAGLVALCVGATRLGRQLIAGILLSTVIPTTLAVASETLCELWDQVLEQSPARWLRAVQHHPAVLKRRGRQLINLTLLAMVIPVLPRIFPFAEPLWSSVGEALAARLEVGGISLSAADVLTLMVGIALAIVLARFIRFVLDEDVVSRLPVAPGAATAATRLLYYLLLTVGLLMALAAAGFELSQLTLVVSAFGVGIGFGLQNIVNNFVSGIVLAFERPFQAGDLIAVGENTGRVLDIGLRATTVRTLEGAEVVVPNSTFISGEVINWTLSDRMRRITLPVGVAYGSDLRQVQSLLLKVCQETADIAASPEPVVVFTGFGESSLDFRVLVWTPDADRLLVTTSQLAMGINDALKAAGVEIPFPQRDIHVRSTVAGAPSSP